MRRALLPKTIIIPAGTVISAQEEGADYTVTVPLPNGEYMKILISDKALTQLTLLNPKPSII